MFRLFTAKVLLKKSENMFECMEIPGTIYEGGIEPFYKNY